MWVDDVRVMERVARKMNSPSRNVANVVVIFCSMFGGCRDGGGRKGNVNRRSERNNVEQLPDQWR